MQRKLRRRSNSTTRSGSGTKVLATTVASATVLWPSLGFLPAGASPSGDGAGEAPSTDRVPVADGVIRTADGKGAPGAEVRVFVARPDGRGGQELMGSAVTDKSGQYRVVGSAASLQRASVAGLLDVVVIAQRDTQAALPQYSTVEVGSSPDGIVLKRPGTDLPGEPIDAVVPGASGDSGRALVASSGAQCYTALTFWEATPLPDTTAVIGQHLIAQFAGGWTSSITYQNTKSTAWEVGSAVSAGVPSLVFNASGSISRDSSVSVSATNTFPGSTATATNRKQTITIGQNLHHFRCWQSPSTPPAYVGFWPEYSVSAVADQWERDFYGQNLDAVAGPSCKASHDSSYSPGSFSRSVGSSYTQAASFGAQVSSNGKYGNYSGSATVKISKTSGKNVTQTFNNSSTGLKHLCGMNTANIASVSNVGQIVAKA